MKSGAPTPAPIRPCVALLEVIVALGCVLAGFRGGKFRSTFRQTPDDEEEDDEEEVDEEEWAMELIENRRGVVIVELPECHLDGAMEYLVAT